MIIIEKEKREPKTMARLPQISVEPSFRDRVMNRLENLEMTYAELVRQLLRMWLGGDDEQLSE